jgi:uncharacterized protein (DUF983 family)
MNLPNYIISCPRCGKELSSNAPACPHCGEYNSGEHNIGGRAGAVLILSITILALFVWVAMRKSDRAQQIEHARTNQIHSSKPIKS